MSRKALLLVHTNAAGPDREDEYRRWYDEVHIPQLLERIPGIVSAARYLAAPDGPPVSARHLVIYEIEADDPAAVLKEINKAAATGRLDLTPAMDTSRPPVMALYEPAHPA